jgi:CRP-like cAMP-binding protein
MIDKLLLKIRKRFDLSPRNEDMLRSAMTETVDFGRQKIIVPENEPVGYSSLLVDGIACRSTWLDNGERQIMEINLPGDFVDLHSYPLGWLDHDVTALTHCRVVKLSHRAIERMIEVDRRLGRILWFLTMLDASIHREWLVTIGSRPAVARIAHLFCELCYRLNVVGLVDSDNRYHLPLRQADIADSLGLTPVHTNRKLKELREMGLCTFQDSWARIHDLAALERAATFDARFLFLEKRTI